MNECPHCGSQSFHNGCSESDQYRAVCDRCGAVGPVGSDWWDAMNSMCHPEYLRSKYVVIEPGVIQDAVNFMKVNLSRAQNYTLGHDDEVIDILTIAISKTKKGRTAVTDANYPMMKKALEYEDAEHASARPLK